MNLSTFSSDALQKIAAEAVKRSHARGPSKTSRLPLKVGTRASPLALVQTRNFLTRLTRFCPVLRDMGAFEEFQISTSGDRSALRLADIGGKGLFSKEIHEVLLEGKIDFAVHSLKDLETNLPEGLVLGCTLKREDARDVLVLRNRDGRSVTPDDPLSCLPEGAMIGCASVRRQAQLLHYRPDLRFCLIRGNVQTRLDKMNSGQCDATLLALAGLRRLGMEDRVDVILDPSFMVPASGQGIVGVTIRESNTELRELLSAIEDPEARAVATAERALLAELDGSCRTPIGGYARLRDGVLYMSGLVASEDGSFYLRKETYGAPADAEGLGQELAMQLRRDTPEAVFADITRA